MARASYTSRERTVSVPNGRARVSVSEQEASQLLRRPNDATELYLAAVATGLDGSVASVRARVAHLAPGITTDAISVAGQPCIALLISSEWSAGPLLATVAATFNAVVILLDRRVSAQEVDSAQRELAGAAAIALRVCPPRSVIGLDELRPYRPLVTMPRHELNSLIRETLGGILSRPAAERDRLIETLWARHQHDTDSAAVRALGIDPRTLRRRRDRVLALTGLDPARQRDRFRLDLGIHALRLISRQPMISRQPLARDQAAHSDSAYPRECVNAGVRTAIDIASGSRVSSRFAPHRPQQAV